MTTKQKTIAERLVALFDMCDEDWLIAENDAKNLGFDLSSYKFSYLNDTGEELDYRVSIAGLLLHTPIWARKVFDEDGCIAPNMQDFLFRHFELSDGSWVGFEGNGSLGKPFASDGNPRDAWGSD